MNLSDLFSSLSLPTENPSYQFSAIAIPDYPNHRIARDKAGNPVLLLSIKDSSQKMEIPSLKLENVHVQFHVKCSIYQGGTFIERVVTIISFIGKDPLLQKYFIKLSGRLVEDLGNTPLQEDVRNEIAYFIELLRLATEPPRKTIQGLWSELLLIAESTDPAILLRCWHCIPEEKFDFNNGEERLEVKSSSGPSRIHAFSLDQLNSPKDTRTVIASVFVRQASGGKSIDSLIESITDKISTHTDLIEKLTLQVSLTLGKAINDIDRLKFDYEFARDSIRFYDANAIPQILPGGVPSLVTDVRFKSDLDPVSPLQKSDLMSYNIFRGNGFVADDTFF